jgi:3-hydroxyacyl-[acyl-carrier-protein] dehydratase
MSNPALNFTISADHPCLPGHFPGQPVVPGVVVLDEVLALARASFGERALARLPQLKFAAPLLPEQRAELSFEPREERLRFRVMRGEDLIASGELVFAGSP